MNEQRTPDVGLDRLLTDWLDADAAPRAPESLETAFVEGVATTRQRPAWATTERWISMETRAQLGLVPSAVIILLTLALLAIGAVGGYAIGSALVDAADGSISNGAVAFTDEDGGIWAVDPTGQAVRLTDDGEHGGGMEYSRDGTRFSYESSAAGDEFAAMVIRDADGSDPIVVSEPLDGVWGHGWSPDGKTLVFAAAAVGAADELGCSEAGELCGLRIYSALTDGSRLATPIGDPSIAAINPIWTPDGQTIIFAGSTDEGVANRHLYRMDADGSGVRRISDLTGTHPFTFQAFDISPDGTTLLSQAGDGNTDIWSIDLESGAAELVSDAYFNEFEARWSPDGSRVVFNHSPGSWDPASAIVDVGTGEIRDLHDDLRVLGWSPDGRSVYGQYQGQVGVLDVEDASAEIEVIPDSTDADPGWQPLLP